MRFTGLLFVCCFSACATTSGATGEGHGITFIEDDYAAALKAARERDVPLFVDAWAPWCHSCVFLREHVLTSPQLQHNEKRFVFLAINTEKESNTPFLEKYPVEVWPTLFVVDAANERPVLKWLGTGTVEQLEKLFEDGERTARASAKSGDPLALLAEADRLYAERKDALPAYQAAVSALPEGHPRRPRAIESLINAAYGARDVQQCAQLGVEHAAKQPRGPSFVNTVALSLSCASMAEASEPWRLPAIAALEPLAFEALKLDGILADDKSGIYELLVDLKGDDKLALEWLEFLEAEAAKATSPAARAVFDPHRVGAAIAAKQPLRAEAALKQSERDLPDDYNPPARLAIVYREAGRLDDAMAAIERGFTRVYGPRKLRLYEIKSSILAKKGDVPAARAVLQEGITYAKNLPGAQRSDRAIARVEEQLKQLK
ncbi:MAG: thioredoxin family protein [Myxococcaceae bacterium]|nr:thioredoxin family protein [Myxococcaceae bacterium]